MKADELRALAGKVAAAIEDDIVADCAIFATVYPDAFGDRADAAMYARTNWTRNRADWAYLHERGMPRYTASLDAAMSLVPEGLAFTVGQNVHHRYWVASVNELDADGYPRSTGCSDASRSPALALTCAALLARASLIDSQTETTHD